MDDGIKYPTWANVGVPKIMVDAIQCLPAGPVLDYLILNRVFRFNIRAQYIYRCESCSYEKRVSRYYEDYSSCERCGSSQIASTAYWRMGKDKVQPYSQRENMAAKVIQQMPIVYSQYFRDHPPDDFIQCEWEWSKENVGIPQSRPAYGRYNPDEPISGPFKPHPLFSVQFCCGELVVSTSQIYSICKAAVLCPFLWDDCFDWKHMVHKDQGRETHILPLLNFWARLIMGEGRGNNSSRYPSIRPIGSNIYPPAQNQPDQGDQGAAGVMPLPKVVVQALQADPEMYQHLFGGENG